jgi:hypothetical protein
MESGTGGGDPPCPTLQTAHEAPQALRNYGKLKFPGFLTLVVGQFPPFLASPPPNIMSSGCWDMTNVRRGGAEGVIGKASMQVDTGCPILPRGLMCKKRDVSKMG